MQPRKGCGNQHKGSGSRKYFWCFANVIKFFHRRPIQIFQMPLSRIYEENLQLLAPYSHGIMLYNSA
uniref:Uncharacterized protein n=1 Tax=Populus trichocarpa TaxID=3694 RepID=A0A3N7EP97_POPTR